MKILLTLRHSEIDIVLRLTHGDVGEDVLREIYSALVDILNDSLLPTISGTSGAPFHYRDIHTLKVFEVGFELDARVEGSIGGVYNRERFTLIVSSTLDDCLDYAMRSGLPDHDRSDTPVRV